MRRRSPLRAEPIAPERCSVHGRLAILASVPFFAGLDPGALAEVNGLCRERAVAADEVVYLAGAPAEHLYIVAAGEVKLIRYTSSGAEAVVDLLAVGDAFGSLSVLGENTYSDSAVAHRAGCLLALGARDFAGILARHPSVAQQVVAWLAQRLDNARTGIQRMSTDSAEARIASALLMLADRTGAPGEGGTLIQMPLARTDLAALAGTTPETASRVLAAYRRAGWVRTGRRWVAVVDRGALNEVAAAG